MEKKMITISVSPEVHKKLLEMKREAKEEWKLYVDEGWTKKEIMNETFAVPPTFDGVVSDLLEKIKSLQDSLSEEFHCLNCCNCDDCSEQRYIRIQDRKQSEWETAELDLEE